jgi:micrococcal nuclease
MRYIGLIAGLLIGFAVGFGLRPKVDRVPTSSIPKRSSVPTAQTDTDCAHDAQTLRCVQFDHNYDGDTITFQIPNVHPIVGRDISVRVYGIDTPEMKGKAPCEKDRAVEARDLVKRLLSGAKRIDLRNIQRDKYFRILAEVVADGVSLSERLVGEKLAYPYDGGTKAKVNWCQLASRP